MKKLYSFLLLGLFSISSYAQEPCEPGERSTSFDGNNVKTDIYSSSLLWMACEYGHSYEIPKNSGKSSLFAGAIWVGGVDDGGQLHLSSETYRQSTPDFWPGPLNQTGTTTKEECHKYDKPVKINKYEVLDFIANFGNADYTIPTHFYDYPAEGNVAEGYPAFLAPFVDANNDNKYNPNDGDYPDMGIGASSCEGFLKGHQNVYAIFNDGGANNSLGVEIHRQAYGFNTTDVLNNTTLYDYKMINRSSNTYKETVIGQWIDPDIGSANDDYVGVEVMKGIGYSYNGDNSDEGAYGYENYPPAIGHKFLQGPLADAGDGIDNDFDGVIDEVDERIKHSANIYYNSDWSGTGSAYTDGGFYNHMRAIWRDSVKIVYGLDGRTSGGVPCNFMYPGDSDPQGFGTSGVPQAPWSEYTAGNTPADRRFVQSAGPFTLAPGAVINWTSAMVWSQSETPNDAWASVEKLFLDSDTAQMLFDNCFDYNCAGLPEAIDITKNNNGSYSFKYLGYPDNISWDFGDGNTSTDQFPSHNFSNGIFEVCATVSTNCETKTVCGEIKVVNPNTWPSLEITRIQGQGNGGQGLSLTDESINQLFSNNENVIENCTYKTGEGPINVLIIDENKIPSGDIFLTIIDSASSKYLKLTSGSTSITTEQNMYTDGIQYFNDWGIAIESKPFKDDVIPAEENTGFFNGSPISVELKTSTINWIKDDYRKVGENWVNLSFTDCGGEQFLHPNAESVFSGAWAPYAYCNGAIGDDMINPAWGSFQSLNRVENLGSTQIIITSDKSKWTRVPVIEINSESNTTVGNANKMNLRESPSVNKDGESDGTGNGYGWFPGFAVNTSTGERLNMMFAENSAAPEQNGADMLWNPTSEIYDGQGKTQLGGAHYIYVFYSQYQGDDETQNPYFTKFSNPTNTNKRNIYKEVTWVGLPALKQGAELLSEESRVTLKVAKPYESFDTGANLGHSNPVYKFNKSSIGVKEESTEMAVVIYPNPSQGQFKFILIGDIDKDSEVSIYNMQGQLILHKKINNKTFSISLHNHADGVYFYQLKGIKNQTGKLVKH